MVPVVLGLFLVGAVVLGGNGVQPVDVTAGAQARPAAMGLLAATWMLLVMPAVLVLRTAVGLAYLRTLPVGRGVPWLVHGLAIAALQLPWTVLWLVGGGVGIAMVATVAMVILLALALAVRWPRRPSRVPTWRRPVLARVGVHARALTRTAPGTLLRGAGLALLTGMLAGMVVAANAGTLADAAPVVLAIAIVGLGLALAGVVGAVAASERAATIWLRSLGVAPSTRAAAVALVQGVVGAGLAGLAAATALVVGAPLRGPGVAVALLVGAVLGVAATGAAVVDGARAVVRLLAVVIGGVVVVASLGVWALALAPIVAGVLAAGASARIARDDAAVPA